MISIKKRNTLRGGACVSHCDTAETLPFEVAKILPSVAFNIEEVT